MKKEHVDTSNFDLPEDNESYSIETLKKDMDVLRQLIHQKGLDVGLPRMIIHDINAIMSILDRMRGIWDDEGIKQKERESDDEIVKKLNSGNEVLAYHRRTMQVLELREERIKMRTFLSVLRENISMLQSRLIGKDMYDLER